MTEKEQKELLKILCNEFRNKLIRQGEILIENTSAMRSADEIILLQNKSKGVKLCLR